MEWPKATLPAGRALMRTAGPLVRDHQLWSAGAALALGVSGGKDSLVLLAVLLAAPALGLPAPRLTVLHVPPPRRCPCAGAAARLPALLRAWGLGDRDGASCAGRSGAGAGATIEAPAFVVLPDTLPESLPCDRCARERRRLLFSACVERNIPRLALAHHQDDLVQTLLMNMMFHGKTEATMAPRRSFFAGKVELVRPLLTTPEKRIIAVARKLDVLAETNPEPNAELALETGAAPPPSQPDGQRAAIRAWLHGLGHHRDLVKNNLARIARAQWCVPVPPDSCNRP